MNLFLNKEVFHSYFKFFLLVVQARHSKVSAIT